MRRLLPIGLALAALSACGKPAPKAIVFTPQSIVLPDAVAVFAETPAGEALTVNCTACHSPEMILNQPKLDATKWQAEIDKMRKVYHAAIPADQDAGLVRALTGLDTQKAAP